MDQRQMPNRQHAVRSTTVELSPIANCRLVAVEGSAVKIIEEPVSFRDLEWPLLGFLQEIGRSRKVTLIEPAVPYVLGTWQREAMNTSSCKDETWVMGRATGVCDALFPGIPATWSAVTTPQHKVCLFFGST